MVKTDTLVPSAAESGKRLKIAHVVPSLDIGGVEIGIQRSTSELNRHIDYEVFFVRRRGRLACGQRHVSALLWMWVRGEWVPDAIVTSLWWAHPVGLLFQLLGVPWLGFFHSTRFVHGVDAVVSRLAWDWVDYRFVDSESTGRLLSTIHPHRYDIVPYLFTEDSSQLPWSDRPIDLIWVGRPAPVKRLDLVSEFVRILSEYVPDARLCLIIAGALPNELALLTADVKWKIEVRNSIGNSSVRDCLLRSRFYLLLSDSEGMSMGTVEAILAGCVPVVRPVGGIAKYIDLDSILTVGDISSEGLRHLAKRLSEHWRDEALAQTLTCAAREKLAAMPTYTVALLNGLRSFVLEKNT